MRNKKTQDWSSVITPKVLIVGENSTLQWSEEVIDHVMFLDYYFRHMPYDHGERSRYVEARSVFDAITALSAGRYRPEQVYATNIAMDELVRPPRGKHLLIPEKSARQGVAHIRNILKDNPSIETVFAMSIQTNYWMQHIGLYGGDADFLHGAQPRNVGITSPLPYYQPVNAKVFGDICGRIFDIEGAEAKLIPILAPKDHPLSEVNYERFGAAYESVRQYFSTL